MKLLSPSDFSLRSVRPYSDAAMPQSELIVRGVPAGRTVTGAVLEAAIEWGKSYLVFVTDDIPQEDTLRIYLFDPELDLVDSATLGAMYSTGAFSELELVQPNVVRFRFIGGVIWTLELMTHESFAMPFVSDPKGVSRPFRLSRRFKLQGHPLAESGR